MSVETTRKHLTQKQTLFCLHYFKTGRGVESAIAAGYSPATAHVTASQYLDKPRIQAELARLNAPLEADARHSKQFKLNKLAEIYDRPVPKKVTVTQIADAIDKHNKAMGVYSEDNSNQGNDNRTYNIIVAGDASKSEIEWLVSGGRRKVDGDNNGS